MAHEVRCTIPKQEIKNADIEFKVRRNGEMFGTLKISKGGMVWVPKDAQKGYKVNWGQFAQRAVDLQNKER